MGNYKPLHQVRAFRILQERKQRTKTSICIPKERDQLAQAT